MDTDKVDFTKFTDVEILDYCIEHSSEFADGENVFRGNYRDDTLDDFAKGHKVVEKIPQAFAIIRRENRQMMSQKPNGEYSLYTGFLPNYLERQSYLDFLYVSPHMRRKSIGQQFMQEILGKYVKEQDMKLTCFGESRRNFFKNLGFVESESQTAGSNESNAFELIYKNPHI